jgi:hypothetical protein
MCVLTPHRYEPDDIVHIHLVLIFSIVGIGAYAGVEILCTLCVRRSVRSGGVHMDVDKVMWVLK